MGHHVNASSICLEDTLPTKPKPYSSNPFKAPQVSYVTTSLSLIVGLIQLGLHESYHGNYKGMQRCDQRG